MTVGGGRPGFDGNIFCAKSLRATPCGSCVGTYVRTRRSNTSYLVNSCFNSTCVGTWKIERYMLCETSEQLCTLRHPGALHSFQLTIHMQGLEIDKKGSFYKILIFIHSMTYGFDKLSAMDLGVCALTQRLVHV